MSERSLRSRILAGTLLWTVSLLFILVAVGAAIAQAHPAWIPTMHRSLLWIAGAIIGLAGYAQWRLGISPLSRVRANLTAVREGREQRLAGNYPSEMQALADDLNALLDDRAARVTRAQAQAGDLAHALKTPLAVLSADAAQLSAAGQSELADSMRQQIDRMQRQIDWHLARARAAASGASTHARTPVRESADGLARTLRRLHAERPLDIDVDVPGDLAVRCERQDLDEMLGNLIDNACKYARRRVRVNAASAGTQVTITVDDDGAGLDATLRSAVLERGVRADEAAGGSGFGLAIVRDLAELYGGRVTLEASPMGGLRAGVTLPKA